ncbi:hypothetical protein AGMMS50256_14830 [Betaproteobacteria bacterium]|nr:hypothetical protein AGMMS50256_14830 [Betaproteobacteria bacterium]
MQLTITSSKIDNTDSSIEFWQAFYGRLGKLAGGDAELPVASILASYGLQDALLSLSYADEKFDSALRLFACHCARGVIHIYEEDYPEGNRPHQVLEVAERFARGEALRVDLAVIRKDRHFDSGWEASYSPASQDALGAAEATVYDSATRAAQAAAQDASGAVSDAAFNDALETRMRPWPDAGFTAGRAACAAFEADLERELLRLCRLEGEYGELVARASSGACRRGPKRNTRPALPLTVTSMKISETEISNVDWKAFFDRFGKGLPIDGNVEAMEGRVESLRKYNDLWSFLWFPNIYEKLQRALRLFACRCARSVIHLYEESFPEDERPRQVLEAAEKNARGKATHDDLDAVRKIGFRFDPRREAAQAAALNAAESTVYLYGWKAARAAAENAHRAVLYEARKAFMKAGGSADTSRTDAWFAARDAASAAFESDLKRELLSLCRLEGEYGEVTRD